MPDDGWLTGVGQVIINNTAGVVSNNLYDVFGVLRHPRGSLPPSGKRVTIYPNEKTRRGGLSC